MDTAEWEAVALCDSLLRRERCGMYVKASMWTYVVALWPSKHTSGVYWFVIVTCGLLPHHQLAWTQNAFE